MEALIVILHACLTAHGPCHDQTFSTFGACMMTGSRWLGRAQTWADRSNVFRLYNTGPEYSCHARRAP